MEKINLNILNVMYRDSNTFDKKPRQDTNTLH